MRELRADLFEDGRLDIRETARFHTETDIFKVTAVSRLRGDRSM